MASLTLGELFAGYGGIGMGIASVFPGVKTAWTAEVENAPARVLERSLPGVPNVGDVRQVDWRGVPNVDIMAGGFPCQDVSVAGKRRGMKEGTRSGLWSEFARAIETVRPKVVVIENVRGLLSAEAGGLGEADGGPGECAWCVGDAGGELAVRALGAVLWDLADLGFDAEWGVFRASDAGAPHRRERVFILAWRRGAGEAAVAHARGITVERQRVAGGVGRSASGSGVLHRGAAGDRGEASAGRQLMPTPEAALALRGGAMDPARRRAAGSSVSLADAVHVLPTVTASEHTGPGHAGEGAPNLRTVAAEPGAFGRYQEAIDWWADVLGRPAPSPTEQGPRGGRRLSAAFAEWMMGLPEGHVTGTPGLSRAQQLRMLGNGVVPQQAAMAIQCLVARAVA